MPFDPAPREVKVGQFQEFADAMLRGCAITKPCKGKMANEDGETCALGAVLVGYGRSPQALHYGYNIKVDPCIWGIHESTFQAVYAAYKKRYGSTPADDNDNNDFTREQIAARIAAL